MTRIAIASGIVLLILAALILAQWIVYTLVPCDGELMALIREVCP